MHDCRRRGLGGGDLEELLMACHAARPFKSHQGIQVQHTHIVSKTPDFDKPTVTAGCCDLEWLESTSRTCP